MTQPKRADQLVVGDRIPDEHLAFRFNQGPAEVVFVAYEDTQPLKWAFVAYRYPNGQHDSMTIRPEAVLQVYPAPVQADPPEGFVATSNGLTPADPVCPVCRSRYSKHNALGLRLHGLAPANEYDESLDALAPCQPIGCDNGHHVPGCFYAKADA